MGGSSGSDLSGLVNGMFGFQPPRSSGANNAGVNNAQGNANNYPQSMPLQSLAGQAGQAGWWKNDPYTLPYNPNPYDPNDPVPLDPNPPSGYTDEAGHYWPQPPQTDWQAQITQWNASHPGLDRQRGYSDIEDRRYDQQPGFLGQLWGNMSGAYEAWKFNNAQHPPATTSDPMSQGAGYNDIDSWYQSHQAPATFNDRWSQGA